MSWATSTRRSRLPADWSARRAVAARRAGGLCQADQHERECDGVGAQCDHIDGTDDHSIENLQWLSVPCHRAKTQQEAATARAASRAAGHRPPERHPLAID